ncbi:MAG: polynucleotide adenylyltransferase PcnB [Pseudomonadales bacterium]|nr:polynucleotide adenylyltransferase PcnB [Pseudomonadales bacterium]
MLKRLIRRLSPASLTPKKQHRIIPRDQHPISRKEISQAALKVMYGLNEAGFAAYLVGGGVRDILLEMHPKDFDIATNATPEQILRIFRNAHIIGRRFKIVHIRFGREIIEVTTFRGHHQRSDTRHQAHASQQGLLLRDNVYGTIEEDALRRDFTVNALYYSVDGFTLHDFCNGLEDLEKRILRVIGDPPQRYREDPVRILRAIRLAAKLGFSIHKDSSACFDQLSGLLTEVPAARLFDEVIKLLMSGHAVATSKELNRYSLLPCLFPATAAAVDSNPLYQRQLDIAFRNTDERIANGKTVTPYYLFAALLWPALQEQLARETKNDIPFFQHLHRAMDEVIQQQLQITAIPRRFSGPMKDIWQLQYRLHRYQGKRAKALAAHPRFRAAYDFLLLREEAGEELEGLGSWWTNYQQSNPVTANDDHDDVERKNNRRPRKPRTRTRKR